MWSNKTICLWWYNVCGILYTRDTKQHVTSIHSESLPWGTSLHARQWPKHASNLAKEFMQANSINWGKWPSVVWPKSNRNNYLLWIVHIIKHDSFIYKSQEHTNVQIKINIPFLYFTASNRRCQCFGGVL